MLSGVGMKRCDRRLNLVFADGITCERRLENFDAGGDHRRVPARSILVGKRNQAAGRHDPGRSACVMDEHQREQSPYLRLVAQGGKLPGQADRFGGQIDITRIAFVEEKIEHTQNGRDIARLIEPDAAKQKLGATYPLRHRRFGHEIGVGDLPGRQAGDRPECERDRRRRRERRMRAEEVEPERIVDGLDQIGRRLAGELLFPGRSRPVAPYLIDVPSPGGCDEPSLRIVRRIVWPGFVRLDQGRLDGILGRIEVGAPADKGADHSGDPFTQFERVHFPAPLIGRGRRRCEHRAQFEPFANRFAPGSRRGRKFGG